MSITGEQAAETAAAPPSEHAGLSGWRLPDLAAPDALLHRVRGRILDQPGSWPTLAADGHWLADWLWPQWAGPLETAGASRELVASVVAGYRQELWLWLMGERTWEHTLTGLAGRIRRRTPALSSAAAAPDPRSEASQVDHSHG